MKIDFTKHGSDKAAIHSYAAMYERLLLKQPKSILEIGVHKGGSVLAMLEACPDASITGIDIEKLHDIQHPNFEFLIGSYEYVIPELVALYGETSRTFDLIIDDGSNEIIDQIEAFELGRSLLADGGSYVIENIQKAHKELPGLLSYCPAWWTAEVYYGRALTNRDDDVAVIYNKP